MDQVSVLTHLKGFQDCSNALMGLENLNRTHLFDFRLRLFWVFFVWEDELDFILNLENASGFPAHSFSLKMVTRQDGEFFCILFYLFICRFDIYCDFPG